MLFLVAASTLAALAYAQYAGQGYLYLCFTIVSNGLLLMGFRKKAMFFDAFIGVFLWLGFWAKLSIRTAFANGLYHEPTGAFDGSGAALDHALLVSCCGMLGLILASLLRERFFCYPEQPADLRETGLYWFYQRKRRIVLSGFFLLVVVVALSNAFFGFYQRGTITATVLPYRLNGVYAWLVQFGLASGSALIIRFEIELARSLTWVAVLTPLVEGFFSNVSLLSRGMVLNFSALIYGTGKVLSRGKKKLKPAMVAVTAGLFVVMFSASVLAVNFMRTPEFQNLPRSWRGGPEEVDWNVAGENLKGATAPLFIDRWVGIEGVLAVSSYPKLGPELWHEAWAERYSEHATSYYDMNLIESPYARLDKNKHHYVSMPGVIAFFYYPGSYVVLFGCLFALGLFAALLEAISFWLGGANLVLCSLMAQVIAYRYTSFGYVPAQSYLLFGSLILNLVMIYCANLLLMRVKARASQT